MDDDPFVRDYDESELKIAAEFLTNWLPFLTRDLCPHCSETLTSRIRSLTPDRSTAEEQEEAPKPPAKMSWADMAAQEEEEEALVEMEEEERKEKKETRKVELTRERRERLRFANVGRKKDFLCLERIKGKVVNVLQGLELHTNVFSAVEQNRIVDFVYELQRKGRNGELGDHTYSEPEKWMRGKGRVTIQFGCCYNYAVDKEKNPPGILRHVPADPLPSLFKVMTKRLVRWHVLPSSCIPNSCIVNIYEPGDCIPPHIDNHDFVRPFCTISFLSECNIVFGSNLKIIAPGEFTGTAAIPLPVGSVLVLNGNGADVAKHCVPAVPSKRISITFRKMDEKLHPYGFKPEPDLLDIEPLPYESDGVAKDASVSGGNRKHSVEARAIEKVKDYVGNQQPSSSPEPDLHVRKAHEEGTRQTSKVPSRQGSHHRRHHEGFDAAELEGSSRRVGRHVPVSDSPGILPLPPSHQEDANKQRKPDMPVHTEMQNEHTPHRLTPDKLKPQNESIMRIICMDNRRIVVNSNPDDKEGSSWTGPGKEHGEVVLPRLHSVNPSRRRVKVSLPRS